MCGVIGRRHWSWSRQEGVRVSVTGGAPRPLSSGAGVAFLALLAAGVAQSGPTFVCVCVQEDGRTYKLDKMQLQVIQARNKGRAYKIDQQKQRYQQQ